jgi:hypothetical protein
MQTVDRPAAGDGAGKLCVKFDVSPVETLASYRHAGGAESGDQGELVGLPSNIVPAGMSSDTRRGSSGRRRLTPGGRAVKRRAVRRRDIGAMVGEEFERRLVRARVVAGVAAAEDPKRVRAERLPPPAGRALVMVRVHGNGRREARPAVRGSARRASNSSGGSSDSDSSDGEAENRPGAGRLTGRGESGGSGRRRRAPGGRVS